jgi:DNA-directed RNA polymerase specialized sigma subunit
MAMASDMEVVVIGVSNNWTDKQNIVREKLRSYRSLISKYQACELLYESLYPRTTTKLKSDLIRTQSDAFEIESIVDQRIDIAKQMQSSLDQMVAEIGEIMEMIKSLPTDEYTIILRRYTLAQSMEDISDAMFISVRQCWEYHRRAIIRLAESLQ